MKMKKIKNLQIIINKNKKLVYNKILMKLNTNYNIKNNPFPKINQSKIRIKNIISMMIPN